MFFNILVITELRRSDFCLFSKSMSRESKNSQLPLTQQDQDILSQIFAQIKVEDLQQIEAVSSSYSVAPLEPWEELGWIINSSLPSKCSRF